ncbi:MAG: alpha/beta fold hydrolase [Rubrivivax sp.]|nr:alpha/beta fold hydrolase [Rubrivivax sp.]
MSGPAGADHTSGRSAADCAADGRSADGRPADSHAADRQAAQGSYTTQLGPAPSRLPADWPHRGRSHTVKAGGLHWHVQHWPAPQPGAPLALLLHGSGASSHSWAALAPLLARTHAVLAPDLPGHAFTSRPRADGAADLTLPGVARSVAALLQHLGAAPALIVGHSAGAAIAAQLCLGGGAAPQDLFSLNGAWFAPGGSERWWYSSLAKVLTLNPLVPHLFAWQAQRPAMLQRLIDSTGSRLDAQALSHYRRLVADPAHVAGVLAMMAAWNLPPLLQALPRLQARLHLLVGERDGTVPPQQAGAVQRLVPGSRLLLLPGLGHLAHEEDAPRVLAAFEPG